ncbi:hypothetical protein [Mesorhizobium sp. M0019]|uniref:hypothetical protein n=1 Tax=unclassified Mesorhizobium TaxID=325217 RepID=UPI00333CF626
MEIATNGHTTSHLMTSRRYAPLFWTQFLSAFNDNFLKNTLVFLILFTLAADKHLHGGLKRRHAYPSPFMR